MNIFERFWPQVKKEGIKKDVEKIPDRELTPEKKSPIPSPEEKILSSSELDPKTKKNLGDGSTQPNFIETKEGMAGIFKTRGYLNERAAYIVDQFFGFNLVPTTVLKNLEGGKGSFQKFIPDAKTFSEVKNSSSPMEIIQNKEKMMELIIFDFLIGNIDRHEGNFLLGKEEQIFAIDHHLSFNLSKRTSSINDILGKEIPVKTKGKILDFSRWKNGIKILNNLLGELLEEPEVDHFKKRLKVLENCARKGRFLNREEFDNLKL